MISTTSLYLKEVRKGRRPSPGVEGRRTTDGTGPTSRLRPVLADPSLES